jgi:hypothetical protein
VRCDIHSVVLNGGRFLSFSQCVGVGTKGSSSISIALSASSGCAWFSVPAPETYYHLMKRGGTTLPIFSRIDASLGKPRQILLSSGLAQENSWIHYLPHCRQIHDRAYSPQGGRGEIQPRRRGRARGEPPTVRVTIFIVQPPVTSPAKAGKRFYLKD